MITLIVNGRQHTPDTARSATLLWALREGFGLMGTKFGCGRGVCGACTVLIDGKATRSCSVSVGDVEGKEITTIEGLPRHHPVKRAWIAEQVPQCGYCQPGQIMQAAAFLERQPDPSTQEIVEAMDGVLCRCGTYPRIIKAIRRASAEMKDYPRPDWRG